MSLAEGRHARDEGIARALANPSIPPWRIIARQGIRDIAATGAEFTSEDLRSQVGSPPSPAAMGAVFNQAAKAGEIVEVAFVQATRKTSHAGIIRRWVAGPAIDVKDGDHMVRPKKTDKAEPKSRREPAADPPEGKANWQCLDCKAKIIETPGQPSVDSRFRLGKCPVCLAKHATFRTLA